MPNEQDKSLINKIRDGAFSMEVGDENDGPITGMVSVDNKDLYIVKKYAIYRIFLADAFDPKRKNPSIPNGNQKIVSHGSYSDIAARSFLTADVLFNTNQTLGKINLKKIIDLSIVIMKELIAAQIIEFDLLGDKNSALSSFKQPKQRAVAIPSVERLDERLKTFIQKIEHATQAMFAFTQEFYDHKEKMWNGFEAEIKKKYGESDNFYEFAASIRPFMVFIRNLRHCIEHPKDAQCVVVKDFRITADGTLENPTLQVIHSETPQPQIEVMSFLTQISSQVLDVFETLMIHIASKNISPSGNFKKGVGFLPVDQMGSESKVRASYFIWFNNSWSKLG